MNLSNNYGAIYMHHYLVIWVKCIISWWILHILPIVCDAISQPAHVLYVRISMDSVFCAHLFFLLLKLWLQWNRFPRKHTSIVCVFRFENSPELEAKPFRFLICHNSIALFLTYSIENVLSFQWFWIKNRIWLYSLLFFFVDQLNKYGLNENKLKFCINCACYYRWQSTHCLWDIVFLRFASIYGQNAEKYHVPRKKNTNHHCLSHSLREHRT